MIGRHMVTPSTGDTEDHLVCLLTLVPYHKAEKLEKTAIMEWTKSGSPESLHLGIDLNERLAYSQHTVTN